MLRLSVCSLVLALIGANVSCMTTYDVNGRPMQTVDPAVAIAGVAAAGLIGYSAANNNRHDHYRPRYYGGGYYRSGYYRGGYRRY